MLSIHAHAQKAAEAAEAAGAQGAFWPYHDLLFENQARLGPADADAARQIFVELAESLDLDVDRFTRELDGGAHAERVTANRLEAEGLGLPGTPTILFEGQALFGESLPPTFFYWDAIVQLTLLADRQYDAPPPMTIDTDREIFATVTLASGEAFVIQLLPKSAPETVNSFVFLVNEGWFDGVTFHRVLPGFVAQTGDPTGTGFGGPGYVIPSEIDPDLTHAEPGTVAMANSGPDTNGSQWYITLGDASQLDGGYTIFGRVVEGLDVVSAITPRDPAQNPELPPGDRIEAITIETR